MNIQDLTKEIEKAEKHVASELYSADGLVRLQEVARAYNGEDRLIWSDDLLKELSERPKTAPRATGIPKLDSLIGGMRPQQLVTISANSKHGKTSFAMFLIEQMQDMHPVMIPLEQSNEELVEQRHENGYSIPRFLSPRKLAARVTLDWIEQRIVEGIAKYNTRLVVIDHLGYIDDYGESGRYARENLAYRIQVLMQGIKTMAKKWNVTVLLLVHISQADEGKPPSLQDLKGSSSILQESDLVMMLWRKNNLKNKVRVYSNKTMVSVLANRRTGKNGNVGLAFNATSGRYDPDDGWVEAMVKSAESSVAAEDEFDEM